MRDTTPDATLVERLDLHADLAVFRIELDPAARFEFEPGQFTNLALPDPESARPLLRAYSIASAPDPERPLEFLVAHVEQGAFTTRLFALRPGERLWVDPRAYGSFTLREAPAEVELALVATGTGIAPFAAMVRRYAGTGRWRRLALLHGARTARDLAYRDELEALAREDPSFAYLPTLTREPEDGPWTGARGRVQGMLEPRRFRELAGFELDPERVHAYLCGSPEMVRDLSTALGERGFRPHRRR